MTWMCRWTGGLGVLSGSETQRGQNILQRGVLIKGAYVDVAFTIIARARSCLKAVKFSWCGCLHDGFAQEP